MMIRKHSFFITLLVILLCSTFYTYAFADNDDNDLQNTLDNAEEYIDSTDSYIEEHNLRVSASDTTGFQSVILSLLGDYTPVVKDYTYITISYNGSQTTNHVVDIQPDYSWIASAVIFAIVIYCTFRFLGGIFSGR